MTIIRSILISLLTAALLFSTAATARAEKIIAVGDSIVQGAGSPNPDLQSWPSRIGAIRAGVNGGCVITVCFGQPPMSQQFDSAVLAQNPNVVIIAYGINDIAAGQYSAESIVDGLANLAWRARAAGARVYVQTLIPLGPRMWFMEPSRIDVNNRIRARFANVIDPESALINRKTGALRWAYDCGDNLHPNAEGYRVMADVARAALG